MTEGRESEVIYRGDVRHVRRLRRGQQHAIGASVALRLEHRGKLQHMQVDTRPAASGPPTAGKVGVRVCAVGLNFKDVLNVLMPD